MDGVTALAKHIKDRDNPSPYTPIFGKIISLPQLKIQLGSRILLDADDVKATFDIYKKIHHDGYRVYSSLRTATQPNTSCKATMSLWFNRHRLFCIYNFMGLW